MNALRLADRLRQENPSVQDLELAAEQRLADAEALLAKERFWGAVYLLGYAAEIYLKIIAYRRPGARPNSQAHVMFRRCRAEARELRLEEHHDQWEAGHGLLFWARLIWSMPAHGDRVARRDQWYALYRHVYRVEQCWAVNMRYVADSCDQRTAATVLASVEWIRRKRAALWR